MSQHTNDYTGTTWRCIIGTIQISFIVMKAAVPNSAIYNWSWIKVFIPLWISLILFVCWFYSFCFSECCLVGNNTVEPDVEQGKSKIVILPTIKLNKVYTNQNLHQIK